MDECVFCAIVAGRAPAHRLAEDEHTVSFLNIVPATLGHALVVPRHAAAGRACSTSMSTSCRDIGGYELQVMWRAAPVPDAELAVVRARVLGPDR